MQIDGVFFDGKDSTRHPARLELDSEGGIRLHYANHSGDHNRGLTRDEFKLSPRVGNAGRYLYLDDGGVFESADNTGIDALDGGYGEKGWLHRLESHLGWIAASAVVVLAFVVLSFTHGIPWVSKQIVVYMPEQLDQHLGGEVLESLDSHWLSPSQLPLETQARVQAAFEPYLREQARLHPDRNLEVLLRNSDVIGANAMALPSGVIIFTDDLVELARHDNELVAILGHEIGHVAHRHSLQGIVRSSLVAWLIVAITGDISAASEMTATIPAVLADLAYSRDMETEADDYALTFMQEHGLDPNHFANIMTRLSASHRVIEEESTEEGSAEKNEGNNEEEEGLMGFLSSHPPTPERIERFRNAAP